MPARCRFFVDHQVLDDLHAVVARRLEAERLDVRRKIEVVVDRLQDVCDMDTARGALFSFIAEKAVSSPPIVMSCDTFSRRSDITVLSKLRARRRVGARNADVRAAAEVDAADRVDRERHHVIDVPPPLIHSKPSRMPRTSMPCRRARIVAAPITLLIPGPALADQDRQIVVMVHS